MNKFKQYILFVILFIFIINIVSYSKYNYVEYNISPYKYLGKSTFKDEEKKLTSFETYSDLDELGRCGVAFANISKEIMPTEPRTSIGMVKPTGWQTPQSKYDFIDGKFLYNRCHLIAYELAGENDNEKNLITGTRFFNVNGMLPFENKVANHIKNTAHHVLYKVTPIYKGDNLLCSGVVMEAFCIEDDGGDIDFKVFCYNVQPGITIDYSTGKDYVNTIDNIKDEEVVYINFGKVYIINKKKRIIHSPLCRVREKTSNKNIVYSDDGIELLKKKGYVVCNFCNHYLIY